MESDCEWVMPSGWGVPGQGPEAANDAKWQAFSPALVDDASLALVAALNTAAAFEGDSSSGGSSPLAPATAAPLGFLAAAALALLVVAVRSLGAKEDRDGGVLPSSSSSSSSSSSLPRMPSPPPYLSRPVVMYPAVEMTGLLTPRRAQYTQV